MDRESARHHHTCGVLVRARTANMARVRSALSALPGVEVHAADENGQIVITVEDHLSGKATETLTQIDSQEGVISASLVYHHIDEETPVN